jgi:hypothetical protein
MWFYPWMILVVLNMAVAIFVSLPVMGLWTAFFVHMVICGGLIFYMEFKVGEV